MIKAFADDEGVSSIGGLCVENGTAAVVSVRAAPVKAIVRPQPAAGLTPVAASKCDPARAIALPTARAKPQPSSDAFLSAHPDIRLGCGAGQLGNGAAIMRPSSTLTCGARSSVKCGVTAQVPVATSKT